MPVYGHIAAAIAVSHACNLLGQCCKGLNLPFPYLTLTSCSKLLSIHISAVLFSAIDLSCLSWHTYGIVGLNASSGKKPSKAKLANLISSLNLG